MTRKPHIKTYTADELGNLLVTLDSGARLCLYPEEVEVFTWSSCAQGKPILCRQEAIEPCGSRELVEVWCRYEGGQLVTVEVTR